MSDYRRERWTLITASVVILATVALGFVLWFTRSVMIPFVLAIFVVAVVAPLADWLEVKARFRRWMSVPLVMALVLAGTAVVLLLLTYTASEIVNSIDQYRNSVFEIAETLVPEESITKDSVSEDSATEAVDDPAEVDLPPVDPAEGGSFFDFSQWVRPAIISFLESAKKDWQRYVPQTVGWIFGQASSILSTFFLMIIFVFFLLVAREPSRLTQSGYATIESKIRRYLSIKTGMSTLTGVLVASILSILGVPMAVGFGVLTLLLNFIPSIGSIIATFLPLPIACAVFIFDSDPPQWGMLAAAIVLPGTVQIAIGNVIEPRIMGENLQLHPIVILIALVFWGLLWGPVGAIMAVPIMAVIRIATSRFVSLQVVSETLAGKFPEG